jgi:hypothetical protein
MAVVVGISAAERGLASPAPADDSFRLEPDPEFEWVHLAPDELAEHVDRFTELLPVLTGLRREITSALARAALLERSEICTPPATRDDNAVALELLSRYRTIGRELEFHYRALVAVPAEDLAALSPIRRYRTSEVRDAWRAVVRDYDEMMAEVRALSGAKESSPSCTVASVSTDPVASPGSDQRATPRLATFSIDNRGCEVPMRVYIGGTAVGEVPARQSRTFQVGEGYHELCVADARKLRSCEKTAENRRPYLSDGWSMVMRCPVTATETTPVP